MTNLAHPAAGGVGSDAGADHARSAAVYLSGVHPEKDSIHVGPTIDQIAAQKIGQDTPLPSLELSIEEVALELRLRLRLRLLQHHFLEDADHAAADGEQSAGGVREVVRRWQHQRRPARAQAAEPQPARFRDGPGGVAQNDLPASDRDQAQRVSGRCSRDRAAHPKVASTRSRPI